MAALINIIAENVTTEARKPAPREGRLPAVETDEAGAQAWLEAFAALPTHEAEEADSRLHVSTPQRQLLVRHAGGRMILEEGGVFVNATVAEVLARLLERVESAPTPAEEAMAAHREIRRKRTPWKIWVFGALLVVLGVLFWQRERPQPIAGVAWVSSSESRVLLGSAAGDYQSGREHLTVDATGRLVVREGGNAETQAFSLRVGRRGSTTVFQAQNGVLIEVAGHDKLVANGATYTRVD